MKLPITAAIALLLLLPPCSLRAQFYTVTDLGTLGGEASAANDINDAGQIVGWADTALGREHAFLYRPGGMIDLGTLGGQSSKAMAINSAGKIVGNAENAGGNLRAFVFVFPTMTDLGTFGGDQGIATGINDNDFISGAANVPNNTAFNAFRIIGITMSALTMPAQYSWGNGINSVGQVVGFATFGGSNRAFIFTNGQIEDLGTLDGNTSEAKAINASGTVVGISSTVAFATSHAFVSVGGVMTDLGTLGGRDSAALDIGSDGTIVGTADDSSNTGRAFLFSAGRMRDLNAMIPPASGWRLVEARAINASGRIVGVGKSPNGKDHAFLLTPDQEKPRLAVKGKRKITTRDRKLKITGTATDNALVRQVEYRIGNAKFKNAAGTTKWKFTAKLKRGKKKILIRATDAAGIVSATITLTVTRR